MKIQRPRPTDNLRYLRPARRAGPTLEPYVWPNGQVATGRQIPGCPQLGQDRHRGLGR
jgi:hypothetical protein